MKPNWRFIVAPVCAIAAWAQTAAPAPQGLYTDYRAPKALVEAGRAGDLRFPESKAAGDVSVYVLTLDLTDGAIRESLREGREYVAHDAMHDPAGFTFNAGNNNGVYDVGDHVPMIARTRLAATLPAEADIRLLRDGTVVSESKGASFNFTPADPGAYRLEALLTVNGEARPWIYTNPIYLEKVEGRGITLPSRETSPGVLVKKDIAYVEGAAADANKHQLDLYLPEGKKNFPVLIFIHGGSWRSGDRSNYPALGNRFAKEGIGIVVPSYRLMPGAPHPAQVEDAHASVAWTIAHIAEFGGDINRIYLSGHSAGGHLAAYVGLDPVFRGRLRGVMALSGVYDVSQIQGFRGDPDASPIRRIGFGPPAFLITYCQNDYPSLPAQARAFDAALKKAAVRSELVYIPNKNHISEIVDVYQENDPTARAILRFMGH